VVFQEKDAVTDERLSDSERGQSSTSSRRELQPETQTPAAGSHPTPASPAPRVSPFAHSNIQRPAFKHVVSTRSPGGSGTRSPGADGGGTRPSNGLPASIKYVSVP